MPKSAQDRFDEMLNESRAIRGDVNMLVKAAYEKYGSYSYAAGYLQTLVGDLIAELPKARRLELRAQLVRKAAEMNVETV